jgi:two-component system OmpR family response regulator
MLSLTKRAIPYSSAARSQERAMRILIVDDEIVVAELLAEAVRSQGHEVTVVNDAQEGLRLLRQQGADAVFLDVYMPEMSGIEFLRSLRRTEPTLPVILITGQAGPDDIEEARRLGIADVVEKPSIIKHLSEALASLERSRL